MSLIVNFTPTGMVPTRAMTPHVPIGVDAIVDEVRTACELGITAVHLHARDEQTGAPTHRAETYGRIIAGIREFAPELVICVSLSGRTTQELERRAAPLTLDGALKPDMASLTLSSLNFTREVSINSPQTVQELAAEMLRRGVLPELEAFDIGMINYARYLLGKGLLEPPLYFNLLLGTIAGAQADLLHAGLMVRELPAGSLWSLAGIGDSQLAVNAIAIAAGGGVRVGLEDSIWYDRGHERLARNVQLLERIHRLAGEHERAVMTPRELRSLLGLAAGDGNYGRPPRRAE